MTHKAITHKERAVRALAVGAGANPLDKLYDHAERTAKPSDVALVYAVLYVGDQLDLLAKRESAPPESSA